ncbi:MAG: glycosyltransferase [Candidatus Omnitrophica bacterium]|nr:glycosyltransferase [Candidatus Omnitrophota bacterium]HOX54804.1 glycosyltransferase [Candidatus Omnitrophota bacterium]
MKILVIYATAGEGHKKAAEAISQRLKLQSLHEIILIDALDYTNRFFRFSYSRGYSFLISRLPFIWGVFFWLTNNRWLIWPVNLVRNFFNFINSRKLDKFILTQNPDIVISTHFFSNRVVSRLKKTSGLKAKLISVVTDFSIHHFWLAEEVDIYTVAYPKLKDYLVSHGVKLEKIKVMPIPVRSGFLKSSDKEYLCRKMNIRPDVFTALIVTGAIGLGPIERIVNSLQKHIQLLVVCGRNKKLFNKLVKLGQESLVVFGLVDNMHELMSASDVIITKAGGLTISESLVKKLPMIFFNLIPGQEKTNAKLMQSQGIGFIAKNVNDIEDMVLKLKNNPSELAKMKQNTSVFTSVETKDILDIIK